MFQVGRRLLSVVLGAIVVAVSGVAALDHGSAAKAGGTIPGAGLSSVSCPAVNHCIAVGDEVATPGGDPTPLIQVWNGSYWTRQPTPSIPNTYGLLQGVSCLSAVDCIAVGYTIDLTANGGSAIAEFWNGSSWTMQSTAAIPGGSYGFLSAVSCSSASACTAVGNYNNASGSRVALVEHWNGTHWTLQSPPALSGDSFISLWGVSCISTSWCTAVGGYTAPSGAGTVLVEHWNGSTWALQNTPLSTSTLSSISCIATTFCTAVGYSYNSSGYSFTLAEIWNGLQWGLEKTLSPSSDASYLFGVNCLTFTMCTAVGSYYESNGFTASLAESWNGKKWVVQSTPNISGPGNDLAGVFCPSATVCAAVGAYGQSEATTPLQETWNGAKWSLANTGLSILSAASSEAGLHYCFDGGDQNGPTHGSGNTNGATQCGAGIKGFDCTGLTLYAVYQAIGVVLPHGQGQQYGGFVGTLINKPSNSQLQVGDLLLFGGTTSNYVHTGVYAGNGYMWDANIAGKPYSDGVQKRLVTWEEAAYSLVGAVRFP